MGQLKTILLSMFTDSRPLTRHNAIHYDTAWRKSIFFTLLRQENENSFNPPLYLFVPASEHDSERAMTDEFFWIVFKISNYLHVWFAEELKKFLLFWTFFHFVHFTF